MCLSASLLPPSPSLSPPAGPLLERLCSALLYPDEGLKTSLFYVWQRVCGAAGGSGGAPFGALSLPGPLRERLCMQLLQTLEQACCPQLTINCLGETAHCSIWTCDTDHLLMANQCLHLYLCVCVCVWTYMFGYVCVCVPGLLLQLLKLGEVVSFLMNSSSDPGQGQDQDPQTTTPQLSLPLILKKVLAAEELILTRGCHEITC